MLLNQFTDQSNPPVERVGNGNNYGRFSKRSGGRERELGVDMRFRMGRAVRASGAAGLGAGAQGLVDDGLDGARAAAAFGAAAEAAIDLLGVARKVLR